MGKKIRLAAIIVLYKERLDETESYRSLLAKSDIPVMVYDNSPEPQAIPNNGQFHYVSDTRNSGVSAAYNRAMSWARELGLSHLLLMDSDSVFPADALASYQQRASEFPGQLILPSLRSGGHRISPFYFRQGKTHYGDDIAHGTLSLGEILAINSGTLLPLDSLEGQSYNEALPLDWSDVEFMRRIAQDGIQAQHIPLEIQHGLSEHTQASITSAKYRFGLYLQGISLVAKTKGEYLLMFFWAKLKGIKLSIRYRSLWFVKQFFIIKHG